jgi:penicillin-binding protein 1A
MFLLNAAIAGGIVCAYLIYLYSKDLPDYKQLEAYNPPVATRVYASNAKLLEEYAKENRLYVPIESVPERVKNAFIAAEDKNFYSHSGIDYMGIIRAAIQNAMNIGSKRNMVGGSTITQQVVKNFLLTNEKSFVRKIKEAVLSYRISNVYSKDRILELYLNQIFLGHGSYGIVSASLNYFNKSIDDLSVDEAAFLATLPKAPTTLSSHKNLEQSLHRRNYVLQRMYDDNMIPEEEYQFCIKKPLILSNRSANQTAKADFFAETVRRIVLEKFGEKALYEEGLYILTSVDTDYQKNAEKAFRKGLLTYDKKYGYKGAITNINPEEYLTKLKEIDLKDDYDPFQIAVIKNVNSNHLDIQGVNFSGQITKKNFEWALRGREVSKVFKIGDVIATDKIEEGKELQYKLEQLPKVNGGMVVMDPYTGRVLAMVGGFSFGRSKYNRVTQAKRQPGSSFKPFVYLNALENGFTPSSIIEDRPIEVSQGPGMPLWRPKNYYKDFLGPTTLRRGLELSRNTMTVNLAQMIGIENIAQTAKKFNISDDPKPMYSMVLGAMETSLLRMATAYCSFVNGGKKVEASFIDLIQDKNGQTIYTGDNRICEYCKEIKKDKGKIELPEIIDNREQIIDPQNAYQIVSILEGAVTHTISAKPIQKLGLTLAGKTGTTNDSNDSWFIGFSPQLLVGIYIGYDRPKSLGSKETGATVAQPIFVDFIKDTIKVEDDMPFRIPKGIRQVRVNYETGLPSMSKYGTIYESFKEGTEPKMIDAIEYFDKEDEEEN